MLTNEEFPIFYLEPEIGQRLKEVPMVCGTKCHSTSTLLASAVLSCHAGDVCTRFYWRNMRERDHSRNPDLYVKSKDSAGSEMFGYGLD